MSGPNFKLVYDQFSKREVILVNTFWNVIFFIVIFQLPHDSKLDDNRNQIDHFIVSVTDKLQNDPFHSFVPVC